ncbi:Na+/H+ antiporter subunit E [Thauera sp.]|uniref:Na+/H+ antiporter subunit E n=1 Tax=Thauera sp. TaxID=1905334 RepID=UPI002BB774C7|nr:Na+/H+ antiporter subunit E [Thauera sp.]HRP22950.1 Na+/H+ antiporter subunit E [Thauera sp.]
MLGVHILLAVGLAAFVDALSPLGVLAAFVVIHFALRLGSDLLGLRRYVRRLEYGTRFAFWFAAEIFKASIDVARIVLGRTVAPQPAIIRMRLARRDERVATLLGCLLTLTPGTLAMDYAPETGVMYIHAIDADDADEVEAGVREIERRLLAWLDAGEPRPTTTTDGDQA